MDRAGEVLVAAAADLDGAVEALSLLRTLRCTGRRHLEARAAGSVDEAIRRLEREVAWTYPAFALRDLDWSLLCDRSRGGVDPADPLPGLQRWVAHLADAHTRVQTTDPVGHVPYTARVRDRAVRLMEIPPGSPAADAGVRTGDVLLDVDVDELWGRTGAPAHLRPWLVGRLALAGPADQPRSYRIQRADGTTTCFTDTPGLRSGQPSVLARPRDNGTGYLRIASWLPGVNDLIDDALHELRGCDRLLVDLRGNVGGSLVEAAAFRDRFLDQPTRLGTIRFSNGDGELSPATPIDGHPSGRIRWHRRTRFLTDALTYSASEDAILGLRQFGHIDTAGSPSGGGSGRARTIRLLDGIDLHVSTALTYEHDGHGVEGAGIPTDLHLDLPPEQTAWTLADLHW
jgi:carboxyl-terminal processing protease